jgi:hypothetical protein
VRDDHVMKLRRATCAFLVGITSIVGVGVDHPIVSAAALRTSAYVPFGPLRLSDTRDADCRCIRLDSNTISVDVAGRDGMPSDVVAAAITVTATPVQSAGFVTVYPGGTLRPLASTLNTRTNKPVANSAIVSLGADGRIELYTHSAGDLVVDVTGVFVSATSAHAGRFVSVTPARLVDTREPGPLTGALVAGGELTIPLPAGVSPDATALAVNVTSVDESAPGFLAARPAGSLPSTTSFVNLDGSEQAVAATAILPVSASGLTITSSAGGHVIVDLLGWFTGSSATLSAEGLFVPIGPKRLLDTRLTKPRIWSGGTIELPTDIADAGSLVTNVTATATDHAGYVTAYPAGTPRPGTSTLNPAMWEHTLANLAITQISSRGMAYYAHAGTDLVVDVTGMFTGTPVAAPESPAPNAGPPGGARVLMVGDSTLAAVPLYSGSVTALIGFEPIVDAGNCRRLVRPSCLSPVTGFIPNTAFEAIMGTPGRLDIVVIKTGYNDWNSNFPWEFDTIVNAARSKGAHTIIWLSYSDNVASPGGRRAYQENNIDLFQLTQLPQYSDVLIGNWRDYTAGAGHWSWDGAHLTELGSYLLTDYIARWVAAIEHRPCPRPWGPGGPSFDPCPSPDSVGAVPDVRALY